jgi:predicted acylesterase/phospholipase RssA
VRWTVESWASKDAEYREPRRPPWTGSKFCPKLGDCGTASPASSRHCGRVRWAHQLVARRRPVQAVLLSCGGASAAYEVGVLKALLTKGKRRLDPKIFAATSMGGFNASLLVSQWESYGRSAIARLEQVWLDMVANHPWRPTAESWHELVRNIDFVSLRKSSRRLRLAVSNLRSGALTILRNLDLTDELGPLFVHAAAAIPGEVRPVVIGADPWADGRVVMNSPLNLALRADAEELHVIYFDPPIQAMPLEAFESALGWTQRQQVISWAMVVNSDIDAARRINGSLRGLDELGRDPAAAKLDMASLAKALGADWRRPLTIHRYCCRSDLAGADGLANFERTQITRLIERGFEDGKGHDCIESSCVVADEFDAVSDKGGRLAGSGRISRKPEAMADPHDSSQTEAAAGEREELARRVRELYVACNQAAEKTVGRPLFVPTTRTFETLDSVMGRETASSEIFSVFIQRVQQAFWEQLDPTLRRRDDSYEVPRVREYIRTGRLSGLNALRIDDAHDLGGGRSDKERTKNAGRQLQVGKLLRRLVGTQHVDRNDADGWADLHLAVLRELLEILEELRERLRHPEPAGS